MKNISLRKLDKERVIVRLLNLDLEFSQKVKSSANKLGLSISKFIVQVLSDYFIKLEEKSKAEQNIKVVSFKSDSFNETQREQEQNDNNLIGSDVVDIEEHLREKVVEQLVNAWGTSEEKQREEEYLRILGKKFEKENITR